jgi:hypothetical protein
MAPLRALRLPVIATAEGAGAGALVAVVAFLLARYGPTGSDWSFRGNGALAAYALIPAFLAGGWTSIAMGYRERPRVAAAFAAAGFGVALAAVDAALLPVFGAGADRAAGPVVLVALFAWAAVAPATALFITRHERAAEPATSSTAAALLWAAGLAAGLVGVGFVIPAGS